MNADLLHVQLTPPPSEKRIGGADLIEVKVDTQASVKNATIRKVRFIGVLQLWLQCAASHHLNFFVVTSLRFSPSSRDRQNGFVQGKNGFVAAQ
jgi:hypothetical protein